MSEIDWVGYGECPRCPALTDMPCIGGRVHGARPFKAVPPSERNPDGSRKVSAGVLDAVNTDLKSIDVDKVPGGHTYRAIALWLADVIDKRGQDDGPSVTAKLAERLQATMQALTRKGGDDGDTFQEFTDKLSEPVR
jgi:hypothetical protein